MKTVFYILITLTGAGLTACSSFYVSGYNNQLLPIEKGYSETTELEKEIIPYRDSVEWEMNKVIAVADTNFVVERPNGNLNNWCADALLTHQTKNVRITAPVISLLNTGGLRATINKGNVTVGDLFKVMPFDNSVVWVRMPVEVIPEIADYLTKSGGEPISGASLKKGHLYVNGVDEKTKEIIIITSDYLINGGDKMYFFQKAIEVIHTGRLLRDCLITEAKEQGTLINNSEIRIEVK